MMQFMEKKEIIMYKEPYAIVWHLKAYCASRPSLTHTTEISRGSSLSASWKIRTFPLTRLSLCSSTFDRWEEVFKDHTLTSALIDRLAHKAHVMDISREKGGRFEETIAWIELSKQ